jgi:hypothetical protein
MPFEIDVVADGVLPIAALPDAFFPLCHFADGARFGGRKSTRETRFKQALTYGVIGIAIRQLPQRVDVVGQDADRNSLERTSLFHLAIRAPQAFDVMDQQVATTVNERNRVEKRSAFDLEPSITGHLSFPKRFGGHGAARLCPPYDIYRNFL